MPKQERRRDYSLQWNKNTTVLLSIATLLLMICLVICSVHVYRVLNTYRNFVDSSIVGQTGLDAELVTSNLSSNIKHQQ